MKIKYKIVWRIFGKDLIGEGKPIFDTKNSAQEVADKLNEEHHGMIIHWVEPVEINDETKC